MGQGGARVRRLDGMTAMRLNDEEQDILAGKHGGVAQQALRHQIAVGDFFGAADFVPVTQAHIMADTESLGEAGVRYLEGPRRSRDRPAPRAHSDDHRSARHRFLQGSMLGQTAAMLDLERRASAAFVDLGVTMTDTCISYQTIQAPTRSEACRVRRYRRVDLFQFGLRRAVNFEGGPSALAAGLTDGPRATASPGRAAPGDCMSRRFHARIAERMGRARRRDRGSLAIGAYRRSKGRRRAGSDQLKHFGAAMASFGSTAMFHLVGLTPEAGRLADVAAPDVPSRRVPRADVDALRKSYQTDETVDVVVFSAPQLSLYELRDLAALCDGKRFTVPLLAVTSPQVKPDSDRAGYTARIEAAGGHVLSGMCFYQSYAREIAEANGWKRLATNSAKLVNILGGYGYRPMLPRWRPVSMRPRAAG